MELIFKAIFNRMYLFLGKTLFLGLKKKADVMQQSESLVPVMREENEEWKRAMQARWQLHPTSTCGRWDRGWKL